MIIDCISDLHGHYPELEGGNLLIVAGDLTTSDTHIQYKKFFEWLKIQKYNKKIFIGGNHDNKLNDFYCTAEELVHFEYLCDSGTEFEGLKVWGSPWTKTFPGMNPKCKAFTCDTEEELAEKWAKIPNDVDILITHSPPFGILDECSKGHVGSKKLTEHLSYKLLLSKLLVCGHVHEGYGKGEYITSGYHGDQKCIIVNASHVNEHYQPVNKPVRVIL